MVDKLSAGTIYTAYNGSGTYATVRFESKDKIEIVLPQDFPITTIRTAMVSSKTAHSEQAAAAIRSSDRLAIVRSTGLPAAAAEFAAK